MKKLFMLLSLLLFSSNFVYAQNTQSEINLLTDMQRYYGNLASDLSRNLDPSDTLGFYRLQEIKNIQSDISRKLFNMPYVPPPVNFPISIEDSKKAYQDLQKYENEIKKMGLLPNVFLEDLLKTTKPSLNSNNIEQNNNNNVGQPTQHNQNNYIGTYTGNGQIITNITNYNTSSIGHNPNSAEIHENMKNANKKLDNYQSADNYFNKISSPNSKYLYKKSSPCGSTPTLNCLAQFGGLDEVKQLIKFKGSLIVNEPDSSGVNALMMAAVGGHIDIAKYLIKKGIEINAKDNDGYTALFFAVIGGHANMVKYLIKEGADINIKNKYGKDVINLAKDRGYNNIVDLLNKAVVYNY